MAKKVKSEKNSEKANKLIEEFEGMSNKELINRAKKLAKRYRVAGNKKFSLKDYPYR